MFILKAFLIVLIVYVVLLLSNYISYPYNRRRTVLILIMGIPLSYFAWQIATPWTLYAIPKVLLFMAIVLVISGSTFRYKIEAIMVSFLVGILALISYFICGIIYWLNIETVNEPYKNVESRYILENIDSEKKSFSQEGSILRGYRYVYYYKNENGEVLEGKIPAELTNIYTIKETEKPYIERVESATIFSINRNENPPTVKYKNIRVNYNVYLQKKLADNLMVSNYKN